MNLVHGHFIYCLFAGEFIVKIFIGKRAGNTDRFPLLGADQTVFKSVYELSGTDLKITAESRAALKDVPVNLPCIVDVDYVSGLNFVTVCNFFKNSCISSIDIQFLLNGFFCNIRNLFRDEFYRGEICRDLYIFRRISISECRAVIAFRCVRDSFKSKYS